MHYHIRAWRELRLLTQSELAGLAQVSPSQLSRFERGKATPAEPTLDRIAAALDLPSSQQLAEDPLETFRDAARRFTEGG